MECQNTIKNLKINKNKTVGTVVIVVEGEEDEFRLLKHIFTKILNYNYVSMKRNKTMQHEFVSKNNKNTIIVANTKSSSIKTVIDDKDYKDKIYTLLKHDYNKSLKNVNIYIIWDRDKEETEKEYIQKYYKEAIDTFASAQDNEYEMNGLLLLSYPCYEAYNISNFNKQLFNKKYNTSKDCKKEFNESKYYIKDITEDTILLAVQNMHYSFLNHNIMNYDPSDFKKINEKIYRKEEEIYKNNGHFEALSLISVMLIDLGIIEEVS